MGKETASEKKKIINNKSIDSMDEKNIIVFKPVVFN